MTTGERRPGESEKDQSSAGADTPRMDGPRARGRQPDDDRAPQTQGDGAALPDAPTADVPEPADSLRSVYAAMASADARPVHEFDDSQDAQLDLSRRERERLMRRQLMLDAARAVFAEKGYSNATLEEVASRAEFGKGTLYNYFEGGKEEILFAIFDDLYDALCRLVDATMSPELVHSSPFRQVFEGFLTAIFAFFLDRQDQFIILMKEGHRMMINDQPEKAQYFQKQGERVVQIMSRGIEAAQAKGELRPFPPYAMAHMIMGNVNGYHMHKCLEGCRHTGGAFHMPSAEDSARFLSTFLLDGMLARPDA